MHPQPARFEMASRTELLQGCDASRPKQSSYRLTAVSARYCSSKLAQTCHDEQ
jgi:hypothetical protein